MEELLNDELNVGSQDKPCYGVARVYVGKLVSFLNTKPKNLDSRDYIEEVCKSSYRLFIHTGDIFTDIETGKTYTLGTPSVVKCDSGYHSRKLDVSKSSLENFYSKCCYVLNDINIGCNAYLTAFRLRRILDEEMIKSRFLGK